MKTLSELSLDELIKRKLTLKGALIGFGILIGLVVLIFCFLKPKPILLVPVIAFPITLLPVFISLKSINDEIRSRGSKSPVDL
ncbi:hypothetical protein DBR11_00600 [Pedobacter sp. HMWF019]|uniref:hypothetical protein n=1 Tax=Pedobacter sp. HMWF019 TaxID=2056856 RepID=UPI000D3BA500|nr:hypothetical protein [Pedobacter sp. HMWF019]PTT04050.1 hypothetical protein DBR11_00600 [Pedobacter sp. HMWF019]